MLFPSFFIRGPRRSFLLATALLALSAIPAAFSDNAPPPGFRSLFDGKTLEGWKMMPRLPVPRYPGAPFNVDPNSDRMKNARKNVGKWTVVDGSIVGEQDPPASGVGAYLVSEETFGDFELMVDMKPDWRTDTGFLIRTLPGGSPVDTPRDFNNPGVKQGFFGDGLTERPGLHKAVKELNIFREAMTPRR